MKPGRLYGVKHNKSAGHVSRVTRCSRGRLKINLYVGDPKARYGREPDLNSVSICYTP